MTDASVIKDVPTVDLTHHSVDDLAAIGAIEDVALLLATESQASALSRIAITDVAKTVIVPDDAKVSVLTGMVMRGGESFGGPRKQHEVLVVTGALLVTSPVPEVTYQQIHVTGSILAPFGSENTLGGALTSINGAVTYYRYAEGQQFKLLSGESEVSGETLANRGGTPEDLLLSAGQLIVTTPVTELGFGQLIVAGQIVAPRESEPVLAPALTVQGQTIWYRGTDPRVFTGEDTFGASFFRYVEDPITMVLVGEYEIESDVTEELLKEKVAGISLIGELRAPKKLHGLVQYLTREKQGNICDADDD